MQTKLKKKRKSKKCKERKKRRKKKQYNKKEIKKLLPNFITNINKFSELSLPLRLQTIISSPHIPSFIYKEIRKTYFQD